MKILLSLGFFLALTVSSVKAAAKPNIIFLLVDDMGWGDLSSFGNREARTPNLDRLAKEGLRFRQFYVNAPICSPSRCSLLTGQYAQRWGINSFLADREANAKRGMPNWLDPQAPTLARILKDNGYATGHFGKWHLGGQRNVGEAPLITAYGFDASLTNFEGLGPRVLPLLHQKNGAEPARHSLGSEKLGHGPIQWENRSKVTSRFVDAALAFVKNAQREGKPFFLDLWPDDVHSPWFPPDGTARGNSSHARYLAVLEAMDAQLAPLLDYIESDPALRKNTLIFTCSDNGSEPAAGSVKPFRGFKGHLFEGGIRSPLIVWGPGLVSPAKAGTENASSVLAAYDLAPSVLEIAGVPRPKDVTFDGIASPDVVLGRTDAQRPAPVFFRRPPDRPSENQRDLPDLAMREGKWKLLCEYDGSNAALYDVEADPGEKHDLSARQPDVVKTMTKAAVAWNRSLPRAVDDRETETPGKSAEPAERPD